jgi:ATP-dependent helicase HrpA
MADIGEGRSAPPVSYPFDLPITERVDELKAAISDHQVVIVAGETGSGKSTQLPKICLDLGRGRTARIAHTQPRRIAARTVAERIADELGVELGSTIGYAVRFTDRVGDDTMVKVMTDGLLLAEIQRDRNLSAYDTIIIDEAHERSLTIDFLIGYLTTLLVRRPDLKVIITSATIDTAKFSEHFNGAPVIEVSGRSYPVEVRYRPIEGDDEGPSDRETRDQNQAICDAVEELHREGNGDVLVFLSGEREIRDAADALRRLDLRNTEIMALYARLSAAEQHRVFASHPGRRVVLATNVAETSITVPGVRYVVDVGTARISRYSRRLKVQRLPIEAVSRASANQRAGRCGRVAPGICIRLYDQQSYDDRPEFTEPEILRTNLASVILQMAALRLGDVAEFPFVDPPDARSIADGVALLEELGAFVPGERDANRRLTPLGKRLARVPLDPRLGRMLLEADGYRCAREVAIVAAALSIQDPRERPTEKRIAADEMHRRFADESSDFVGLVKLWDYIKGQQNALTSNQFRKLCRNEFLNAQRVREWQDLVSQLKRTTAELKISWNTEPAHHDHLHRALLSGLLSHLGMKDPTGIEFRGARNAKFVVAPGSVLAKKPPKWLMAGELVETNRLWARTCARIQPEWAERVAGDLVKRSYSDPRWEKSRAAAVCDERVTLYGLPIVTARPLLYGLLDEADARAMFIEHALVEGEWNTHHSFMALNRTVLDAAGEWEHRLRRRDVVDGDDALRRFYDTRLGAEVVSGGHFDRWWKHEKSRKLLELDARDLIPVELAAHADELFPLQWQHGSISLPVTYRFEPGADDDGVTVQIPLVMLNGVSRRGFDWHVPGLRAELVEALIRTLPKALRRSLIPIGDHAVRFVAEHRVSEGDLLDVLAAQLTKSAGAVVTAHDFDTASLPAYLSIRFDVIDDEGRSLGAGRDIDVLARAHAGPLRRAVATAVGFGERRGITAWDFGELPAKLEAITPSGVVRGYPSLVIEADDTIGLRVLTSAFDAQLMTRAALARLVLLRASSPRKAAIRQLTARDSLLLTSLPGGSVASLLDECVTGVADQLVDEFVSSMDNQVRDEASFARLQRVIDLQLVDRAVSALKTLCDVARAFADASAAVATLTAPSVGLSAADARTHLGRLVFVGFVRSSGVDRLNDLVRYLRAIEHRVERIRRDPDRDQMSLVAVRKVERRVAAELALVPPEWRNDAQPLRWMIEEFRVSVFAQTLGAAHPVSEQRIDRALHQLRTKIANESA